MPKSAIHTERINWLNKELSTAYLAARRGKLKKPEVVEFGKNAQRNLAGLAREIHDRSYRPSPSTAFIVNEPVKREIFAADFRDRVVHHFLFNQVNAWWDGWSLCIASLLRAKKGGRASCEN